MSRIIVLPHPALRKPSRKIGLIDQAVRDLNQIMVEESILWEQGRPDETTVGLAAVQINRPLKIILVRKDLDPKAEPEFQTLINPKITKCGTAKSVQLEGCLSVPDCYANVERFEEIKVSALDLEGRPLKFRAAGFLARIIQHEIDHLKGLTILDKAVAHSDERGENYTFCRLKNKQFEIIDAAEVREQFNA